MAPAGAEAQKHVVLASRQDSSTRSVDQGQLVLCLGLSKATITAIEHFTIPVTVLPFLCDKSRLGSIHSFSIMAIRSVNFVSP